MNKTTIVHNSDIFRTRAEIICENKLSFQLLNSKFLYLRSFILLPFFL